MGYLIAAYSVAFVALGGYALWLELRVRERRRAVVVDEVDDENTR